MPRLRRCAHTPITLYTLLLYADKSISRVTALPQVFEQCATPTTTIYETPFVRPVCHYACIAPTSSCALGEPTGPVREDTTATITAPDLCTVTVSVSHGNQCGQCATCTTGSTASSTMVVNPGGPMITARDSPILDHRPGGPVLSLLTILTVVKRDDPITEGHGGGPMITARDDPITEGHGGGPMISARDDPITEGHGGGPMITARDYPITEGHGGGPLIPASTST